MNTLEHTFIQGLKDVYDAEHQILDALPQAIDAAEHDELKDALEKHQEETEDHVSRLKQVFEICGQQPGRKKCRGMQGLIAEGKETISGDEGDAGLIASLQKIEHYEIAAYGSLVAWADMLEMDEAVDILQDTLDEEKATDDRLTDLAEDIINPEENESEESDQAEEAHAGHRGRKH